MKLHLLGVNGPFPESRGATSGYLLETGDSLFQFDLGSSVLGLLTSLTAPETLSALFVSHWHYDHTADIPVLMYRLQAYGQVLPVYGPEDPSSPAQISDDDIKNAALALDNIDIASHKKIPLWAFGFLYTPASSTATSSSANAASPSSRKTSA